MTKNPTLITVIALLLASNALAQTDRVSSSLGRVSSRALTYFEKNGQNLGQYLKTIRPEKPSAELKARVLANLPKEGEVSPTAKLKAKLAALEPVLKYHDRSSAIDFKVIHAGQAFVGLHDCTAMIISEEALNLLTVEELQAVVAHEVGHDYFWGSTGWRGRQDNMRR